MSRHVTVLTWDDAVHLDETAKADLLQSIQPYQRAARSKGIPQLGAGAVYPFPESQIKIPDFDLPRHFVRAFGLDCALSGETAAAWGALDRESQTLYIYSVYQRSAAETAVHAEAIKARGIWIPGVGDASDILDEDRTQYLDRYRAHDIDLELADKAVESGIQDVYDLLSAGRLKVFASCVGFFKQYRLYRRDERGRIVKQHDHVLDAVRYLVRNGLQRATVEPKPAESMEPLATSPNRWLG